MAKNALRKPQEVADCLRSILDGVGVTLTITRSKDRRVTDVISIKRYKSGWVGKTENVGAYYTMIDRSQRLQDVLREICNNDDEHDR